MKKLNKIIIASCFLGTIPAFSAQLMKVDTVNGKALYYNQYDNNEMTGAGCEPAIYSDMVNRYLQDRGAMHNLEYQARTNQGAMQAPNASGGLGGATSGALSCVDQAANTINGAANKIKSIFNLLNGGSFDFGSIADAVGDQLLKGACQEINRITGNVVNSTVGAATNTVTGGINSATNGVLGQGVNIGSQTINGYTVVNGATNGTAGVYGPNLGTPSNLTSGGGVQSNTGSSPGVICTYTGIGC